MPCTYSISGRSDLPFFRFCDLLLVFTCRPRFLEFIFIYMVMIKPVYSWVRNWFLHFLRWTAKCQKILPSTSLGEFNVFRVSVSDPFSSEVSIITFRNGWLIWESPNPWDLWCRRYCLGRLESLFTGSMVVPVYRKKIKESGERNYNVNITVILLQYDYLYTTGKIFLATLKLAVLFTLIESSFHLNRLKRVMKQKRLLAFRAIYDVLLQGRPVGQTRSYDFTSFALLSTNRKFIVN